MSKAFTTETDDTDDDLDDQDSTKTLPAGVKNYMTPHGFAVMQEELRFLLKEDRPKVVEIVAWAAGNGDRSENGDYLYGKKRLREIDRRVRFLTKRLDAAEVVDPKKQQGLDRVFFGATVTYADSRDQEHTVTIVGVDEADMDQKKISWLSPVAKALMKAKVGDEVTLRLAGRVEKIEVQQIVYRI
jgi:transcription elongation factor GreB